MAVGEGLWNSDHPQYFYSSVVFCVQRDSRNWKSWLGVCGGLWEKSTLLDVLPFIYS